MKGFTEQQIKATMKLKELTLKQLTTKVCVQLGRKVSFQFISKSINDTAEFPSETVENAIVEVLEPELSYIKKTPRQQSGN